MKILLADDEKTIAVTLGDALRGAGHQVTVAADGDQALQALRLEGFDVVITDIRLPKADGLQVLKAARESQPSCKIVLITAFASVEDAVAAIKDGAEDYLQKPFFNDDVLASSVEGVEAQYRPDQIADVAEQIARAIRARYDQRASEDADGAAAPAGAAEASV